MKAVKRILKLITTPVLNCEVYSDSPPLDCSQPESLPQLLPASQIPDSGKSTTKSQMTFLITEKVRPRKAVKTTRLVIFYFSGLLVKQRTRTTGPVKTEVLKKNLKVRSKGKTKPKREVRTKGVVEIKTTGRGRVTIVRKCPVCDCDCRHCDCWPVLLGSAMAFSR